MNKLDHIKGLAYIAGFEEGKRYQTEKIIAIIKDFFEGKIIFDTCRHSFISSIPSKPRKSAEKHRFFGKHISEAIEEFKPRKPAQKKPKTKRK